VPGPAEVASAFRDANESIVRAALELGVHPLVPLLCECADRNCREVVRFTYADYERVRADGARFFLSADPVHPAAFGVDVVERRDRHVTVELRGAAADGARERDPRRSPSAYASGSGSR
jgi:hypothetical protein